MKIYAGLLAVSNAVDIDRSVPPRHPVNRLARLNKFCDELMAAPFVTAERFENLKNKCTGWCDARLDAFENKCGFYDAGVTHGGPDPDQEYVPTRQNYWGERREKVDVFSRKRRADDCADWDGNTDSLNYFDYTDVVENEVVSVQTEEPCAPGYIDAGWLDDSYPQVVQDEMNEECVDDCENDDDVDACKAQCRQVSRSGGSRINRIINRGPWRSARSIVTGVRKWGERYLNSCPGRRSGRHMLRRHNFMKACTRKFVNGNVCSHEECTSEFAQRFKWGGKNLKLENPYLN